MKRALAERAKQSLPPVPARTSSSSDLHGHVYHHRRVVLPPAMDGPSLPKVSSTSDVINGPPAKVPRLASAPPLLAPTPSTSLSEAVATKGETISTTTSNVPVPLTHSSTIIPPPPSLTTVPSPLEHPSLSTPPTVSGHKRQRGDTKSHGGGGVDLHVPSEASAFYLQHQNRALALECQTLRWELEQLRAERDQRRQDCWAASQALHSLQATWTQLETVLTGQAQVRIMPPEEENNGGSSGDRGGGKNVPALPLSSSPSILPTQYNAQRRSVSSTGKGDSVEWTKALADALASLGAATCLDSNVDDQQQNKNNDSLETISSTPQLAVVADWSKCAANLSARAQILQERLWPVIQTADKPLLDTAILQKQLVTAQGKCTLLRQQLDELVQARDAVLTKERKTRRNVYRLASGIITMEQLVQALESDEELDLQIQRQVSQEVKLLKSQNNDETDVNLTAATMAAAVTSSESSLSQPAASLNAAGVMASAAAASEQLQVEQKKILNLQQFVANREKEIQELTDALKEREGRITQLTMRQRSDADEKNLQELQATKDQLLHAQQLTVSLQEKVKSLEEHWAQALANEQAATEFAEQQNIKFTRRWSEVTASILSINSDVSLSNKQCHQNDGGNKNMGITASNGIEMDDEFNNGNKVSNDDNNNTNGGNNSNANSNCPVMAVLEAQHELQTTKITELQHKLDQSIENVRQAEATRQDLRDALHMNKSLQAKLEEYKVKLSNATAEQMTTSSGKDNAIQPQEQPHRLTSSASKSKESSNNDVSSPSLKDGIASSNSSAQGPSSSSMPVEKIEKLQREHRRMRKELAAHAANKEAAKAKLERAEKERDILLETNSRLLAQIVEKDEMNAKSLSTILHLKSLTEKSAANCYTLEQQVKSASQLALAARLATNAKDRVSEELEKEKEAFDVKVKLLEDEISRITEDYKGRMTEWSEASSKMAILQEELSNALKRSDELVLDLEQKNAAIRKLNDIVSRAERNAEEAKEKLERETNHSSLAGAGDSANAATPSSSSIFSVDQLNTQVSVLKNRLACPVCHYRDKECIIMRCRHMHCKQCVDERISNRSRKCPTCNNKFSDKDVEDIWLN